MINALTVDGLRVDIWLHPAETIGADPARIHILYDPDERIYFENSKDQAIDASILLPRIREFWRCISLTPTVIGRQEFIVSFQGLSIGAESAGRYTAVWLRRVTQSWRQKPQRFSTSRHTPGDRTGNIATGSLARSLARAQLALARVAQTHGRIIAVRHQFEYPANLERTVLHYVHKELALLGIDIEPDSHIAQPYSSEQEA